MLTENIAIIGSGHMGTSLAGGLIAKGYSPVKIWMTDPDPDKLAEVKKQFGIQTSTDNKQAAMAANVIILAVKPQLIATVCEQLAEIVHQNQALIISVAAGIREASLQTWLGDNVAIVRSMPNMPALIGCGASALYANTFVSSHQHEIAESILRAVGVIVWLDNEKMMDTVTALSGSGPAYFFLIMECLQNAAEELGLPKDISRLLTIQTALGSARLAIESEKTLSELRHQVTSPGGTTERAIRVLEETNIRHFFTKAVTAAKNRSEELAGILENTKEK